MALEVVYDEFVVCLDANYKNWNGHKMQMALNSNPKVLIG